MKIAAAVVIVAAGTLLASSGPRTGGAAVGEGRPRTLLTTRAPIVSFAQDGPELAWVEQPVGGKRCRRVLHFRSVRRGRETTARIGCGGYDDLALAGTRVLWKRLGAYSSLERDVVVVTMSAGQRRPRPLQLVHVDLDPPGCQRLDRTCRPEREPVLAGGGGLLAYSTPEGVRRVVRGIWRARLPFPAATWLDIADGRMLAARSELRPGDGCGCASAPASMPDGSVEYLAGGELARVDVDGSDRNLVTHDTELRSGLAVSRDGTRIAYVHVDPADSSRRLIAVAAPDGSGAHDLGEGGDPAWSPDGTRLAFARDSGGASQIYVMDADGGNATQLTQGAGSGQPSWSPDGTTIAYVVDGGISLIRPDGSGARPLGLAGSSPDWSPDGSRLVFVGAAGISIANADGSDERLVLPGTYATPRWSADGSSIVFQGASSWWDVSSRYELYLVHPDGTGLRPLTFADPAGWASPAEVRDTRGRLVARLELPGTAYGAAIGGQNVAIAEDGGPRETSIALFSARTGAREDSFALPWKQFAPQLVGISGHWLVFRAERVIGAVDLTSRRQTTLAVASTEPIALSLSGRRLAWAENPGGHGRIRALTLPR